MTSKLELHNVAISTTSIDIGEERGMIPPNLAKLTETILKIHKVNGDLTWVGDLAQDMELEVDQTFDFRSLTPHTLACIANGLSKASDSADEEEKLVIFQKFNQVTEEIERLMGRDWMVENVVAIA